MAAYADLSNRMMSVIKEALLACADNPNDLENWIKKCGQNLRILCTALKNNTLSVGVRKNIESNIGKIKGMYTCFLKIISLIITSNV